VTPSLQPLVPLERRQRQRVRRGQHEPDASIDLHGMRQAEAHRALMNFVWRAHSAGHRLVLVVTGKGLPAHHAVFSEQERGVLRRMVPHWLAEPSMRPFVLGYEPATLRHGGDGALYVRIRQARGAGSA
jgi:DNA-nicking Smr family endonuclease